MVNIQLTQFGRKRIILTISAERGESSMKKLLSTLLAIALLACGTSALAEEVNTDATDKIMTMISELEGTEEQLDALIALRERIDAMVLELSGGSFVDLERNARGDAVTALQERLAELGYYTAKINGKYDNETTKAVKQFEKKNGLDNDGKASAFDQALMFSDGAIARDGSRAIAEVEEETTTSKSMFNTSDAIVKGSESKPDEPETPVEKPDDSGDTSDYEELSYADYVAEPDEYLGRKLKVAGVVLQVVEGGARVDVGDDEIVYVNTTDISDVTLAVGGNVTIYGELNGEFAYRTLRGANISLPCVYAHLVELAD